MSVQQQCAVTAWELLTWEEPRLGVTFLWLPTFLCFTSIPALLLLLPAGGGASHLNIFDASTLNGLFFFVSWHKEKIAVAAPLKTVGSTACLPVVHPVIVVVVCSHLTSADLPDWVYLRSAISSHQQYSRCWLIQLVPSWFFQISSFGLSLQVFPLPDINCISTMAYGKC